MVYFESGSVGQLLVATIVNAAILCTMIQVKPMGKLDARFLNAAQIAIHALMMALALGGLSMRALEVDAELARIEEDGSSRADLDALLSGIQTTLSVLTFALTSLFTVYIAQRMYRKLPRNSRLRRLVEACSFRLGIRAASRSDDGGRSPDVEMVGTSKGSRLEMLDNPMVVSSLGEARLARPSATSDDDGAGVFITASSKNHLPVEGPSSVP